MYVDKIEAEGVGMAHLTSPLYFIIYTLSMR
jgi:hypothetical protein